MGVYEMGYNTIGAIGRQAGEISGIKGGNNWMREKFGLTQGWGNQFGKAWNRGGFVGLGSAAKNFFGFGFDPKMSAAKMLPYLRTMRGGGAAAMRAGFGGVPQTPAAALAGLMDLNTIAKTAPGRFNYRRAAGAAGLAGAAVLASNTIGLGNLATVGAGAGGGAILGGAIGHAYSQASGGAAGRRIGGRVGAGIAGLGILTGII